MSLQDLLQNDQLEPTKTSIIDTRAQLDKAYKVFKFAEKNLSDTGDEDLVYNHIYDSLRLACTAILFLNGHRVKTSGPGHHLITIEAARLFMNNELTNEFDRIQKMRKKRNKFEYGSSIAVSETELQQGMTDATKLLKRVDELIKERESKLPI